MKQRIVSVVIPVYNEEAVLPALFARAVSRARRDRLRLRGHLRQRRQHRPLGGACSRDQFRKRPDVTRIVILFNGNFGQHMAILAGFEHVRGQIAITLDADLQNPPEEIGKLLAADGRGPRLRGHRSAGRATTRRSAAPRRG